MAKTILVVDDKASVRTLVRDYLTAENFRVVTASNGRDVQAQVKIDYVRSYLPQDENAQRKNGQVVYAYTMTARSARAMGYQKGISATFPTNSRTIKFS